MTISNGMDGQALECCSQHRFGFRPRHQQEFLRASQKSQFVRLGQECQAHAFGHLGDVSVGLVVTALGQLVAGDKEILALGLIQLVQQFRLLVVVALQQQLPGPEQAWLL